LIGAALFGVGFGVVQNATLTVMFERVQGSGYGAVSAMWNLAYDAGLGLGAVGFGVVAAQTGYPVAFALTSLVVLAALVPSVRVHRKAGAG
jgi:predicted MFS family arabinose efflux permease